MRLNRLLKTATLASQAGTTVALAAALTMAPSAWAHQRPHAVRHEAAHAGQHVGHRITQHTDAPAARGPEPDAEPSHESTVEHSAEPGAGQSLEPAAELSPEADVAQSTEPSGEPHAGHDARSLTVLERVQDKAMSLIGVRYRFGGSPPASGFDCSGFVQYVMRHAVGLQLGRTAASQATEGQHVERDNLRLGDLVFFHTYGDGISHVGLYLGNGKFVHAPSSGGSVRVESLNDPYWQVHYVKAKRLYEARFSQDQNP